MKMPLNILIVEDEQKEASQLSKMLKDEAFDDVQIANRGEDALEIVKATNVDLILIKISIKGKWDGIETVKHIHKIKHVPVIYLTTSLHHETIASARKTNPSAVVVKPYCADQISIAIEAAIATQRAAYVHKSESALENGATIVLPEVETIFTSNDIIYIKEKYRFIKVPLADILFLESDNNYTLLSTTDHRYVIRKSLQCLLDKINYKQFIRVHRSYVVNALYITSFDECSIIIGQKEIPFSKKYRDTFTQHFTML